LVAKRFVPKHDSESSDNEDCDSGNGDDVDDVDDDDEEDDDADNKWFTGRVKEHFPIDDDGNEYMVMYCDGDLDDASADEMMQLVDNCSVYREAIEADAKSLGHTDVEYDIDKAIPASKGNSEFTTAVTICSSASQRQQCVEPPLQLCAERTDGFAVQQQFIAQQQQSQTR
jgi:hypothetical protein